MYNCYPLCLKTMVLANLQFRRRICQKPWEQLWKELRMEKSLLTWCLIHHFGLALCKEAKWAVGALFSILWLQAALISFRVAQKFLCFWPEHMDLQKWARMIFWGKKRQFFLSFNIFFTLMSLLLLLKARDRLFYDLNLLMATQFEREPNALSAMFFMIEIDFPHHLIKTSCCHSLRWGFYHIIITLSSLPLSRSFCA